MLGTHTRSVTARVTRSTALSIAVAIAASTHMPLASAQPPAANTQAEPQQILPTNSNLATGELSAEAKALSDQLNLTPLLIRLQELKAKVNPQSSAITLESLAQRQELLEVRQEITEILGKTSQEIDFVVAEISDEQILYDEVQNTLAASRDKAVTRINGLSFYTNGILWALAEALSIPTYTATKLTIPSGTVGVLAGIVPSVASLWAMKRYTSGSFSKEQTPNMLAKFFDYPTTPRIEYPDSVWTFLASVPPNDKTGRSRRDQIVDRWIADKNIPSFTDRTSRQQLDLITAANRERTSVTIDILSARESMLQQLSSEIFKMNRLLLELILVVRGEKHV